MNEKIFRALVEAGAVRRVRIIADGARFHVEADTASGTLIAATGKGKPRTWSTLDASARWVRGFGIGAAHLDFSRWQPQQRGLAV
ncbi:MAG TPA: hypothetical protein VFP92_08150 [Rhodanobacteraceae bacterium]|nr:hypothetical protein [Rhodanobacteraceae bacterium]